MYEVSAVLPYFGVIDFASATEHTFLSSPSLRYALHDSGQSVHDSSILKVTRHISHPESCSQLWRSWFHVEHQ